MTPRPPTWCPLLSDTHVHVHACSSLQDADLVVLEFTMNDHRDAPYGNSERRAYEQLIRKLGGMQGAPAILQLHHYAWSHAVGEVRARREGRGWSGGSTG